MQAHLAVPVAHSGHGMSPVLLVIGGLVVLFLLLRVFGRRFVPGGYAGGYNSGYPNGPFPPGPGGMPYGPGGGGGVGSSILTGLAAGAGFAAGERLIDGAMGGQNAMDPGKNYGPAPDRDDGLTGSPGWDSGNSGSDDNNNFDPGNNW